MLTLAPEVAAALGEGRPVVALESALVAHGLPHPLSVETALAMEAAVRAAGAVPATVGLVRGQPTIGLDQADLERFARGARVPKASLRDLAPLARRGDDGATTFAATLWLAARAGIAVVATGGIGGVHRGASATGDVSADLVALASASALVVCSGPKVLLDLPRTREWLETWGVPLVGWRCAEMPAFYHSHSGLPVDDVVEDAAQAAALLRAQRALGLAGSVVLAVPPPVEAAADAAVVEQALATALAELEAAGVVGAAVTPRALARLFELTGGAALRANVALLRNNARIGGEVAVALAAPPAKVGAPTEGSQ
ncbi:MAG: pseudouridine-5'-phosphate glycosidase [Chloroflexi bacterium]|nr:pseudouridine-5'-phosphate glycosidase [Chloroflexota bacterium]